MLVVEDEMMIALTIEDAISRLGHDIVGPAAKLDTAMAFANEGRFDAAILDVTIRGGQIFPVAELLRTKGIPFAIASGYADWSLPDNLQNQRRLNKPFSDAELDAVITNLCDDAGCGTNPH